MNKKRYVAKISDKLGRFHSHELSPRFESSIECLNFIRSNSNIIKIEYLLKLSSDLITEIKYDENGKLHYQFTFNYGSFIRVYDLEDNRFCDSFDF